MIRIIIVDSFDGCLSHFVLDIFELQINDDIDTHINILQYDQWVHLRNKHPLLFVLCCLHLVQVLALSDIDILTASLNFQVQVNNLLVYFTQFLILCVFILTVCFHIKAAISLYISVHILN